MGISSQDVRVDLTIGKHSKYGTDRRADIGQQLFRRPQSRHAVAPRSVRQDKRERSVRFKPAKNPDFMTGMGYRQRASLARVEIAQRRSHFRASKWCESVDECRGRNKTVRTGSREANASLQFRRANIS
jgi:hypothetical protein